MLGSKDKGGFRASNSTTLIASDAEVEGNICFSGNLDIEGVVKGNVTARPDQDGTVRIVENGRVEGEIRAPSVIINGVIVGDVFSSKHLELAARAQVQGNVHYTLVEMAIGAEVNGSLQHSPGASPGVGSGEGKFPAALENTPVGADSVVEAKS
jgi:cytoskeletal protein CcmA (bactofilin family)